MMSQTSYLLKLPGDAEWKERESFATQSSSSQSRVRWVARAFLYRESEGHIPTIYNGE